MNKNQGIAQTVFCFIVLLFTVNASAADDIHDEFDSVDRVFITSSRESWSITDGRLFFQNLNGKAGFVNQILTDPQQNINYMAENFYVAVYASAEGGGQGYVYGLQAFCIDPESGNITNDSRIAVAPGVYRIDKNNGTGGVIVDWTQSSLVKGDMDLLHIDRNNDTLYFYINNQQVATEDLESCPLMLLGLFSSENVESSFDHFQIYPGSTSILTAIEDPALNEQEPETPVAILSENLDIHIPVLAYQVNEAETQNLELFLSPAPSPKGVLTWQLDSFNSAVCSNTENSCSGNFKSSIASSDIVEENVPFDIHIPYITAVDGNTYWANLGFSGVLNGKLLWQLGQFGTSRSVGVKTCNFPYESVSGMGINNPSCEQKWNLWNYHKLGSTLLRNDFNVLYAKYKGILDRRAYNEKVIKIAQSAIEVVNFTGAITEGIAEKVANELTAVVSNNLTRYISHDSDYLDAVFKVQGILNKVIVSVAGNASLDPWALGLATLNEAPEAINTAMTAVAAFRIGEIVKKLNEINIASEYLAKYYHFGGNAEDTSYKYTGNRASSFEDIIIAVASTLNLDNKWYGDDYNYEQVLEIINHYKNNVIPDITRITSK